MAGNLKWFVGAVLEVGGRLYPWGRMGEPIAEKSVTGVPSDLEKRLSIPVESGAVLYDRDYDGDFGVVALYLEDTTAGFLDLYIYVTKTDGTDGRWIPLGKSCATELAIDTQSFPFTTTANISSWYGDNAGVPTLASTGAANRIEGRVGKIYGHNRSTTAAVTVNRFLVK